MVERYHDHPLFLDEDGTLPLIIDFDHTPTPADVAMLEREIGYEHEWDLPSSMPSRACPARHGA